MVLDKQLQVARVDAYMQGLGTDRGFPGFILRRTWNTRVGSGLGPLGPAWGPGAEERPWSPQLGGETGALVAKRTGVMEEDSKPGEEHG